jgi:hypothetical protein
MQVLKFNEDVKPALRAMGFEIDGDGDMAAVRGEIALEIIEPRRGDFWLTIALPNGATLLVKLTRDYLLKKAADSLEV